DTTEFIYGRAQPGKNRVYQDDQRRAVQGGQPLVIEFLACRPPLMRTRPSFASCVIAAVTKAE
ncbi:hypothetical protein, partial [Mesorhizobium sp. M0408]|uniref:hypothetical protein n=1 Tax=Mesorhizobium sp. M0408 TaxID=2956942 RepID=UPI003339DB2A